MSTVRFSTEVDELFAKSSDAAHYPGGSTPELAQLSPEAAEAEIAEVLRRSKSVLPIGAQSSVTGGATPDGAVVLDLSRQAEVLGRGEDWITVQPGMTLHALQETLALRGMCYPPGPTFDGATVGGIIATNAAGAATFKYGTTRPWVRGLTVVLATGEVIDMQRGEYQAHPDGYFELVGKTGVRRIPVPTYRMPAVPKVSAGYFAEPGMDLVDLFVGSEGTLGVITKATLRIIPCPQISWALVPCQNEAQAFLLTTRLREYSLATRSQKNPRGIDTSAIEYIDEQSMRILQIDSKARAGITPPPNAAQLLFIQLEMNADLTASVYEDLARTFEPDAPDVPIVHFARELESLGLFDNSQLALPTDLSQIEHFKMMREAVPVGVNNRIAQAKQRDPRISKIAADMIVPFKQLPQMMSLFQQEFERRGLSYSIWGHISDGNMHPNVLPQTFEEFLLAQQLIMECGRKVIGMGGSPLAEHGVGRNKVKQALLVELYGADGIEQMRRVKEALDPEWKLARGNLFDKVV